MRVRSSGLTNAAYEGCQRGICQASRRKHHVVRGYGFAVVELDPLLQTDSPVEASLFGAASSANAKRGVISSLHSHNLLNSAKPRITLPVPVGFVHIEIAGWIVVDDAETQSPAASRRVRYPGSPTGWWRPRSLFFAACTTSFAHQQRGAKLQQFL